MRYDSNGLSVRTGWMAPKAQPTAVATEPAARLQNAATRDDLAALERQLRSAIRSQQPAPAVQARSVSDGEVKRLLSESEKRQQRELALRIAAVLNDVSAQRQADLVKIDRSLSLLQNNTGVEVMRQRNPEMASHILLHPRRRFWMARLESFG